MKKALLFIFCIITIAVNAQQKIVNGSWESLNKRGYPEWFSDAKLGIFIHWGLYSVPAYAPKEGYGEWFYRGLMQKNPERSRIMGFYADTTLSTFEQYSQLTNYWHAELWNPDEWVSLFKNAGAKYVLLVTKHHDGYCLWDCTQQPNWNSTTSGPRCNIVEKLTDATRKQGLRMGFYYSLTEWTNPLHIWMENPDNEIDNYINKYMIPQFKELVEKYKPDLIFSDGDWNNTAEQFHSQELISYYYNIVGQDAIVNNRWGSGTKHGFLTPEYSAGINTTDVPWAECRGLGRSFGLNRNENLENFLTNRELIQHFAELVAHGGGMTLNVGPNADGTIPFLQQERLLALGNWLKINGEAIYGAKTFEIRSQRTSTSAKLPLSDSICFDWVRNAPLRNVPTDNFKISWKGNLTVPADGIYNLSVEADDEMTVLLKRDAKNYDTILNYNKNRVDLQKNQVELTLHKDEKLNFEILYKEKDLEAVAKFKWSCNGSENVPVPAKWEGVVYWEKTDRCFTTNNGNLYIIEFQRPDRATSLKIKDLPKINKHANICLLGTSTNLKWKQNNNGELFIDFSNIDTEELNLLENAWVIRISNFE